MARQTMRKTKTSSLRNHSISMTTMNILVTKMTTRTSLFIKKKINNSLPITASLAFLDKLGETCRKVNLL